MAVKSTANPIGLTEFIYQVKRELLEPDGNVVDPVPLLAVEEIELEIAFTVTKKGEAGLNIQVVALGGSVERSDVHSVRVKLVPLLTREERVSELRQDPRWGNIVSQQTEHTLKGLHKETLKDRY